MPRCGDCENFLPQGANSAASTGICKGILEEDGLGREVNIYADIEDCAEYKELDRVRTNVTEFMSGRNLRMGRGFDEK